MQTFDIDYLKKNNLIAYEFIRGSHLHGIATETSDIDKSGVFFASEEMLYGLKNRCPEQISDSKNDTTYYEFGRWVELILKNNPSAIESLYVPDEFITVKPHPAIAKFLQRRDEFITKEAVITLIGYAKSQIYKARGLNKKIVNPVTERLSVLDFCYTFYNQGSTKIYNWLSYRNLKQEYCGLVNIPNMRDTYGCYYDWGNFFQNENISLNQCEKAYFNERNEENRSLGEMVEFVMEMYGLDKTKDCEGRFKSFEAWFKNVSPIGYKGIMGSDGQSNEVRLSSIPKNEKPICFIQYNKDGYSTHCRNYKEYKEWEKNRNPIRYESNLNKNYDAKNMCECMRLVMMGKEILMGKGVKVNRSEDRDFLLSIKSHKYEYEEIINMVEAILNDIENLKTTTSLPEKLDDDKVNTILIECRKKIYAK